MKKSTILHLVNLLTFAFWGGNLAGQEKHAAFVESLETVPGVSLQQGGSFTDPVSSKGLSLSSDLGLTESKQVFGYDALTLNAKWVPGSNPIGRRIFISIGTANWFTPALSELYPDTVLSMEERFQQSVTKPSWIAGLGITLLKPKPLKDADFKVVMNEIKALDEKAENAALDEDQEKAEKESAAILSRFVFNQARKARWVVGGNFRLVELGESADIDVFDLYSTFARGKGRFDFNGTLHYITPRDRSLLLYDAITASAGIFVDLEDEPPVNTLAAIFRYGYYNFTKKERILDPMGAMVVGNQPFVRTFDATITFSGLRDSGIFGSGLGFRYAVRWNPNFERQTEFAVLFTSKFVKERKEQN
jgi:hypothetical protein